MSFVCRARIRACAIAEILSRFAAELALFAGVGFLLFAVNDLLVDLIFFARRCGAR